MKKKSYHNKKSATKKAGTRKAHANKGQGKAVNVSVRY
jgi:hypothetical protein